MIRLALVALLSICPTTLLAQCSCDGQIISDGYYSNVQYGPPISYGSQYGYESQYRHGEQLIVSNSRIFSDGLPTLELYLGSMSEETRVYEVIEYGENQWKRVPVINGIVPAINRTGNHVRLRYDRGFPIERCHIYGETQAMQSNQSTPLNEEISVINPSGLKQPSSINSPDKTLPPSYDK